MEHKLQELAQRFLGQSIAGHFAADNQRFNQFSIDAGGLLLDYSKQNLNAEVISQLVDWANERGLTSKINAMFNGEKINNTEDRAVLHTILRAPAATQLEVLGGELAAEVQQTDRKMAQIVKQLLAGERCGFSGKVFTDVIAVGIGGSYYGPKVCHEALKPYHQSQLNVHYLANVDGTAVAGKLAQLNPETTLVVVISKTFTTQETMLNAKALTTWLKQAGCNEAQLALHLIAVSAAPLKAQAFGVAPDNILPMWDWVGGRFSLWSAVGFPLACAIGYDNFEQLRAGAYEIDQHLLTAPLSQNMPVLLALIGIWNCSFMGYNSLAVLPYDHLLRDFPGYLQQVDMESSGKRVDVDGNEITLAVAPIVFGQEGTNGQHAFMQLMHQSHQVIPVEFMVALQGQSHYTEHHQVLVANCFAQSEALMQGKTVSQAYAECLAEGKSEQQARALAPHKMMPGNSPSSTLVYEKLSPKVLGSIMALYEHKIFVQGAMWNLNSFDQWGVELGKCLGNSVMAVFNGATNEQLSGSTQALIERFKHAELKS
ncbi:MAG: glucose-6-phosphate isomerase [Gammaproteobacteria bacterium]|nr:glucose-6-phosphate isomerase [Gammaproteobacteria bacterium]